ncbi:hypothetical protein GCM10023147_20720 [Tsukamurella soli]|uniref:Uncharacterized protein n=2 Tax=Tsukamurella soli TaxID=644556 RepID=A0ABP8JJL0_9ACTN
MVTSEDVKVQLPAWFVERWRNHLNIGYWPGDPGHPSFPISSKAERKFYDGADDELFTDLRRVLTEVEYPFGIHLILFHECGGVTKVDINPVEILLSVPTGWTYTDGDTGHHSCYGCSVPREDD